MEKRSEEGLHMLQGGSEGPPDGPLKFLNSVRQLPDDIEDNFRERSPHNDLYHPHFEDYNHYCDHYYLSNVVNDTSISAFDAQASNNVAVYYMQSSASNNQTDLRLLCANPAVNIITLPLIATLNGPNRFLIFANTTDCLGPSAAQLADAPNLCDCSNLAETITYCQSLGKKIIIGITGATRDLSPTNSSTITARTAFNSFTQRPFSAVMLLSLFGPPSSSPWQLTHLRPFGPNISVDGFDLGFDLGITVHGSRTYADFIATLRDYTAQSGRDFYISATRPCRRPVSPQTLATLSLLDLVTVKFFDDPACSITGPGFNIWDWSNDLRLSANSTANSSLPSNGTAPLGPKLFTAALAWPIAAAANGTREGDPEYLGQSIGQIWGSGRLRNLGVLRWWRAEGGYGWDVERGREEEYWGG
ncbi:hypothetical protein H2199_002387 [Coniosporium tulheliwenetii]|uniref:Uncharacterized protein n=1 Tax=Coniosporium tulheliwenetii TaxID=3383036 RepID=A0ACC2ZFG5_9PEZI|nr:hypothetical protein H2199_002387 [Cladosporium sp. JES 115]